MRKAAWTFGATALLIVSLATACSGGWCGSKQPAGHAAAGAAAAAQSAAGGTAASAQQGNDGPTPEHLAIAFAALDALEQEIPRDTFDPEAVARTLGGDPQKSLEWVRDHTSWVPYRGALRGSAGVLMDRLGNSLDRSILLAELLRTGGHTVRLVRATLPDARARDVWALVGRAPRGVHNPVVPSAADTNRRIEQLAKAFQVDVERLRASVRDDAAHTTQLVDTLASRVAAQAPFLAAAVGAPPQAAADAPQAMAALRDHWWVQRDENGRWIDVDPLLSKAQPGAAQPEAEQTFAFDQPSGRIPLPSEYAHEVTIRVVIEQLKTGRLVEKTALEHRFRPAEVLGQPILLQHMPLAWPKPAVLLQGPDAPGALKAAAARQTEWLPFLGIGTQIVRQSSFTDTGELNSRPGQAPASPRGSGAMGGFDALGGGEPEAPASPGSLTAEWIEYETRVPGERPTIVRREVFDLLEAQSRAGRTAGEAPLDMTKKTRRALSLLGRVEVLPMVARLSRPFVLAHMLGNLSQNRDALAAVVAKGGAGDTAGAIEEGDRLRPSGGPLLSLGLARFDWSWLGEDVYIDAPNLLSYRDAVAEGGPTGLVLRRGFDIVSNRVDVRVDSGLTTFFTRLAQGVTDTNVEALIEGGAAGNAGALLAAAPNEAQWLMIRRAEDLESAGARWPPDLRRRIEQSLRAGQAVIAPRQAVVAGDPAQWAFWTVNPVTGDTLGIGQFGWGQSQTETAILAGSVVLVSQVPFEVCMLAGTYRSSGYGPGFMLGCLNSWAAWGALGMALEVIAANAPRPPLPPSPPQWSSGGFGSRR